MRKRTFVLGLAVLTVGLLVASLAGASGGKKNVKANLEGFNEVPAVSSFGEGSFTASIDTDAQTITYELSYGGLNSAASAAHIHLGQRGANGGVSAFLCGGGDKPACPAGTGATESVSGVIDAADVIGPAGQGIAAGEFDELVRAIRAGVTYANVHTATQPGGELRGQLR
ncbi:MAG: CHRD domain-containing protein [Gaiellaceae bacterium]